MPPSPTGYGWSRLQVRGLVDLGSANLTSCICKVWFVSTGGRLTYQYQKKPVSTPKCGATGVKLQGVSISDSYLCSAADFSLSLNIKDATYARSWTNRQRSCFAAQASEAQQAQQQASVKEEQDSAQSVRWLLRPQGGTRKVLNWHEYST